MQTLEWIRNAPCEVRFAGFKSDTFTLQKNGWQLSMNQDMRAAGFSLAMKHESAHLYAISRVVSHRNIMELTQSRMESVLSFDIICMGSSIQAHIIPMNGIGMWSSVDATPEFVQTERKRIEDFIPFRPISSSADEIIVDPNDVSALMEKILQAQNPKQMEIRKKIRTAAWMKKEIDGYKPEKDILAQIICLAG